MGQTLGHMSACLYNIMGMGPIWEGGGGMGKVIQ